MAHAVQTPLYTVHSMCSSYPTVHCTLYVQYIPNRTLYTLCAVHTQLYTVHFMCSTYPTVRCTLYVQYIPNHTLYTHCSVLIHLYTVHFMCSTNPTIHYKLNTLHCTLHTIRYTLQSATRISKPWPKSHLAQGQGSTLDKRGPHCTRKGVGRPQASLHRCDSTLP